MATAPLSTSLDGLVALVTGAGGGENAGVGGGIVRCLAQAGARIAVHDPSEAAAAETVRLLRALGADAWSVVGDLTDSAEAASVVERTVEHFGQLDIMVNYMSAVGPAVRIEEISFQEWEQVVNMNVHAPFFVTRAAIPHLRERGYGRIINVASLAAVRVSYDGGIQDTSTREALWGFTRHLAVELTQYGVTANAVLPGPAETPALLESLSQEQVTDLQSCSPRGRLIDPDEVGALVAFLASPAASAISAQIIPVDGGMTALGGGYGKWKNSPARLAAGQKE